MLPNKNKCFLFGGFKKFAILKYNRKHLPSGGRRILFETI